MKKNKTKITKNPQKTKKQKRNKHLNIFSRAINLIRYKIIRSFIFGKIITNAC